MQPDRSRGKRDRRGWPAAPAVSAGDQAGPVLPVLCFPARRVAGAADVRRREKHRRRHRAGGTAPRAVAQPSSAHRRLLTCSPATRRAHITPTTGPHTSIDDATPTAVATVDLGGAWLHAYQPDMHPGSIGQANESAERRRCAHRPRDVRDAMRSSPGSHGHVRPRYPACRQRPSWALSGSGLATGPVPAWSPALPALLRGGGRADDDAIQGHALAVTGTRPR
jgi:hypothetical protein